MKRGTRGRRRIASPIIPESLRNLTESDRIKVLKIAFSRMTDRQQLYFCEYYLRGKSILVIAQEQGVNKTTVARGTRRGMEKVVEVFADIEIIEKEGEKVAQFKTRYGVYKDLEKSPYEYTNPYGDKFKFRSQKKLEIYEREIVLEIDRVSKFLSRLDLESYIPSEITGMIYRRTYQALYDRIER